MKNKNFQILEIGTFRPLSIKFVSETVKDRGYQSTYYWELSTQSIQQQKTHKNWMKNKNSIYLSNMSKIGIWAPFRALFKIK
jgi:hypothetical protein